MKYVFFLLISSIVGCGGGTSDELVEKRKSAQQSFDEGMAAFGNKDFPTAESNLSDALESGGLYGELYDTARATLVAAQAAQSKFSEAQSTLTKLEQTATEKELIFAARSFLLQQQGKNGEAKREFAKAKRINRSIRPFIK